MQQSSNHNVSRRSTGPSAAYLPFLLMLACIFLPACATSRGGGSYQDDPKFKEAERLYIQGSYERAINRFSNLILSPSDRGDERLVARCYQLRGASRKRLGKYSLARYDFEDAVNIAKGLPADRDMDAVRIASRMAIGDTYLNEGAYQSGERVYEELLGEYPPAPQRDALLFRRYICSLKLGRSDADKLLAQIKDTRHFDEKALRREFLEGGTPTPIVDIEPYIPEPKKSMLGSVEILPRERWHAASIRSNIDRMTPVFRITVHHTADVCRQADWDSAVALMLNYQKIHQNGNGWADIGYHFVIDRAGRIWEGRPLKYQGAHAGSPEKNRGNIGVSLMGDFNQQTLTQGQEQSLAGLLGELCRQYRIDAGSRIYTHTEVHATECPGRALQQWVERYRRVYL